MRTYFSQVASRAAEAGNIGLQPLVNDSIAQQGADGGKAGAAEDIIYPTLSLDEASPELIVPALLQSASGLENSADPFGGNPPPKRRAEGSFTGAAYFSTHAERSVEVIKQQVVQPPSTTPFAEKQPAEALRAANDEALYQPANEEVQLRPTQALPAPEETHLQKNKRLEPPAEKAHHHQPKPKDKSTLLHPSPSLAESLATGNKKANKQGAKLVIGKITVEVLPAEKPASPKIVTRVLQGTPASQSSKHSKLGFGLGQL